MTKKPDEKVAKAYEDSLTQHIAYVQQACQTYFPEIPTEQVITHDQSKWGREEFFGYALHFHGGGSPDIFTGAWLHHIHHNPHHWQHWIFPDRYTPEGATNTINGVVRMPNIYAYEMIADWMGAGRAYTGTWDMSDWLSKNIGRIILHPDTAQLVREKLDMLGYADIVNMRGFKGPESVQ